jgi:hypothetical protein
MIMRPGQRLLMPVNPAFLWASLLLAFAANMLGNMLIWGRAASRVIGCSRRRSSTFTRARPPSTGKGPTSCPTLAVFRLAS